LAGVVAVASIGRLTGVSFFERVAMAMVVVGRSGELTCRSRRRQIALMVDESRISVESGMILWGAVRLRRVVPISGVRCRLALQASSGVFDAVVLSWVV
jgi:hypothetical protein